MPVDVRAVPNLSHQWLSFRSAPTRPFVIGRRNWLFADTVAGANASANLYSLLETCRVNGIDAYWYLRAMLAALPYAKTAEDYEGVAALAHRAAESLTRRRGQPLHFSVIPSRIDLVGARVQSIDRLRLTYV